ncbi:hypothetical protein ACFZAV_43100 [Streptomyces sp. NPDC008343]
MTSGLLHQTGSALREVLQPTYGGPSVWWRGSACQRRSKSSAWSAM